MLAGITERGMPVAATLDGDRIWLLVDGRAVGIPNTSIGRWLVDGDPEAWKHLPQGAAWYLQGLGLTPRNARDGASSVPDLSGQLVARLVAAAEKAGIAVEGPFPAAGTVTGDGFPGNLELRVVGEDLPAVRVGWLFGARLVFVAVLPDGGPCVRCLTLRLRATFPVRRFAHLPITELFSASSAQVARLWRYTRHRDLVGSLAVAAVRAARQGHSLLLETRRQDLAHQIMEHPVLPTPHCGCDASAPRAMVDHAVAQSAMVDQFTGIVSGMYRRRVSRGSTRLSEARTGGCIDTTVFSEVKANVAGAAIKTASGRAQLAAMGEAVERYCAGVYDLAQLEMRAPVLAGPDDVRPQDLVLPVEDEVVGSTTLRLLNPSEPIAWTWGIRSCDGRPVRVPAVAVYVPFTGPGRHLIDPTSSGLAAGVGFSDAAVRATLECVERDAWIVSWEQRLTRAVIEFDDCCRGLRRLRRALTANGEQLWCIDITSDLGIPVVLAVSLRTGDSMVCFATSAAWRMHDAVWGALEELAQSQSLVPKLIRQRGVPAGMEQVRRMEDHYTYYCRADRVAELEFLWSGPATRLMHETEPPEPVRLEELAGRLYGCGHEVVVVDVTTCDSRACGVNVVRSVVPGLLPLTYSLRVRRRDHPRLYEVPGRLGISPLARTRDELSDLPRPGA